MRIWQVKFEVYKSLPSFPVPGELVEELQEKPSYRNEGRLRVNPRGGQLAYTLEGRGLFIAGKKQYALPPGKAFFHLHNDPETVYCYPPDGTEPWKFLWISFFGETLEKMINDIVTRYGYIYTLPRSRGIIKKLEAYRNYRGVIHTMTPLAGAKLVMEVLASLGEKFEKEQTLDPQSNLIKNAQELMLEKLDENLGMERIANELNVSREHLSRVFREQTGLSPHEYLTRRKMRYACYLLRDTNLTCKEIASRIGYDDPASFSRAFKNEIKISPQDLRITGYIPEEMQ